jgi:hypothetical protein
MCKQDLLMYIAMLERTIQKCNAYDRSPESLTAVGVLLDTLLKYENQLAALERSEK